MTMWQKLLTICDKLTSHSLSAKCASKLIYSTLYKRIRELLTASIFSTMYLTIHSRYALYGSKNATTPRVCKVKSEF